MAPSFGNAVHITTALLLLPLGHAAPFSGLQSREAAGTFTVTQQLNPNFRRLPGDGAAALRHAFLKYNAKLPANLAAVNGTGSGNVTTSPSPSSYDREYLSAVSIGTPPQVLNLDFDTGSSDLWVFSTDTETSQVSGQKLYSPENSTSASLLEGHTWSISYGDGSSCGGTVFNERVVIGDVEVQKQALEVAKTVSSSFTSDSASSGLVGLGFNSINQVTPDKQKTWFDNAQTNLAAPVFTADLKKGAPGSYGFGAIDTSAYTGDIGYAPVNSSTGFWEFTASGVGVGTTYNETAITAIADTGTTLLLLDGNIVEAYYAQVSGSSYSSSEGAYTFPCNSSLPDFTFGLGSYRGAVPGSYLSYADLNDGTCYGGIQDRSGLPFSIFGDVLLKAQYVVFDAGNTRIGFANKKAV